MLLSGSVGSSKSLLLAHAAVRHCITHERARVLIGRRAMPDLRSTIWTKIIEHLDGGLVRGQDYELNLSRLSIKFCNGSEIMSRSWADGQYLKLRSLELSAAIVEELTENDTDEEKQAYDEIRMRVGRLPHIKQNWIMSATNPGPPSHWAYKYFILPKDHPTRHVFYSITTDNPYLPPQYIEQLKRDLDPKMARRMLFGEWLEIASEVIYYAYDTAAQFKGEYVVNPAYPVVLSWDFNLAEGKPMSMCCMQYIDDVFHVFDEVIIDGGRTADTVEELELDPKLQYIVCGDAAGKHRDTRGQRTDWDIIMHELKNRNLQVDFLVPPSNPGVRNRHNRVNAYCKNVDGQVRLFVYQKAPTVDEGLRLVKLKSGSNYVEDDSKRWQHVTTALGYAIYMITLTKDRQKQGTIQL